MYTEMRTVSHEQGAKTEQKINKKQSVQCFASMLAKRYKIFLLVNRENTHNS